jgi:ribosomal protein S18 acetylase RimI-like enzyme
MSVEISHFDPTKSYTGLAKFDCGLDVVSRFARNSLKTQVSKSLSVALVLTDPTNADRFVGFCTFGQHSIPATELSVLQLGSMPRVVPCTRIIMLGVDNAYKGRQLGKQLMKGVLSISKETAVRGPGSFGVYLDADAGAVSFYLSLGFHLLQDNQSPKPSKMFIQMSKIP